MTYQIFIVSDGTGRTAEQALKAALAQFIDTEVKTHIRSGIRKQKQLMEIIAEAVEVNGIIVHTLVSKKLRELILKQGKLYAIETIDIMGPLLAHLSHHFSDSPTEKPGIFHDLNRSYFQRIEAVEFTFRHDDGQRAEELEKAEIVILGVSRTFKTPLSIYLAYKGWLVANIPVILGMELPEILTKLSPERIFCLYTSPGNLTKLRKIREKHLGGNIGDYATFTHIKSELNYAESIYRKNPKWKRIDVTNKPIEEISSEILAHLRNHKSLEYPD